MPGSRIILPMCLLLHLSCFAQQERAVLEFLAPIVTKIADDPNIGGWDWETNRNGGYLLRMSMDVNGDNREEVFIATSLRMVKSAPEWAVFDVQANGEMRPYEKPIEAPATSVWKHRDPSGTGLVYRGPPNTERMRISEPKMYPLYRYKFLFPSIQEEVTYLSKEDVDDLRSKNFQGFQKVFAILLADYLNSPDARWSEVADFGIDANDCFFRESDKERAASNTWFTPQVALARLNADELRALPQTLPNDNVQYPSGSQIAGKDPTVQVKARKGTVSAVDPTSIFVLALVAGTIAVLFWLRKGRR